jgi:hypothetical protein
MHLNRHPSSEASSPLSSLFAELDTQVNSALSDWSSLSASQWKDVSRRLCKLRTALGDAALNVSTRARDL